MSFLSLSCALSSWRFDVEGSLERVAEATTGFSGREIHKLFLSVQGAVHSSYDNCLTKRIWKKVVKWKLTEFEKKCTLTVGSGQVNSKEANFPGSPSDRTKDTNVPFYPEGTVHDTSLPKMPAFNAAVKVSLAPGAAQEHRNFALMSRAGGNRASEEVGSTIDVVGGGGGGGANGEFNCLDAIASGDAGVFGAAADFAPPISTQERGSPCLAFSSKASDTCSSIISATEKGDGAAPVIAESSNAEGRCDRVSLSVAKLVHQFGVTGWKKIRPSTSELVLGTRASSQISKEIGKVFLQKVAIIGHNASADMFEVRFFLDEGTAAHEDFWCERRELLGAHRAELAQYEAAKGIPRGTGRALD